jgi:type VI secretion system protein ImpA
MANHRVQGFDVPKTHEPGEACPRQALDAPWLERLLQALPPGEAPDCGPELDEIRAARQGEDTSLSMGEWARERRGPQWARVRERCETVLSTRAKDLQVACWYAEALAQVEGFPGLAFALDVLEGLLARSWDTCLPAIDPGDPLGLEERAGRLAWLEGRLPLVIRSLPVTDPGSGGLSWLQWQASREVDNLGLRDPKARDEALAEGRLSGAEFDKAARLSSPRFQERLLEDLGRARASLERLRSALEARFAPEGPGFEAARTALGDCEELARLLFKRQGGTPDAASSGRPDPARPDPARPDPARPDPARPDPARPDPGRPGPAGVDGSMPFPAGPSGSLPARAPGRVPESGEDISTPSPAGEPVGRLGAPSDGWAGHAAAFQGPADRSPAGREQAVEGLLEVARWFRVHEPHSPVAHLAERAARWAHMPLDHWLEHVIKDEGTLRSLRDLLDLGPQGP